MFPNGINPHGSQITAPINNGEGRTDALPPNQGQSQSTRSREKPRTLDELHCRREILLRSPNPAAKILGEALARLHTQFSNGEISSNEHLARCHTIREAAEMLNGSLDIENEVMQALNMNGMTPQTNALNSQEYLAVNDDLSVQLDTVRGIAAVRLQTLQGARSAERGRANLQNMMTTNADGRVSASVLNNAIRTGQAAGPLQRAAVPGPPRVSEASLRAVVWEFRHGSSERARRLLRNIRHPDDLTALRRMLRN